MLLHINLWQHPFLSLQTPHRLMHDSLIATKHCSSAGLVSRKDGKIRGCTATFKLEDFEIKAVSMAFKDVTLARGVRQLTQHYYLCHTHAKDSCTTHPPACTRAYTPGACAFCNSCFPQKYLNYTSKATPPGGKRMNGLQSIPLATAFLRHKSARFQL